jgi:hypothetical protein
MRIRMDSRLSDLAGSGLVLLGFLLVALALSATPVVLRNLGVGPSASAPAPMASPMPGSQTALT